MSKTKQIYSIDIVKLIMAIVVVAIHRPLFTENTFGYYLQHDSISGIAVPFFFIASAYLLFSKVKSNKNDEKRIVFTYLKRIIQMYIIWSIIYIPCGFVRRFTKHYNEINVKMLIGEGIAYIKDFFLDTSFMHLWYLNTLVFTVFVIYLLRKRFSERAILYISIGVFILYYILQFAVPKTDYLLISLMPPLFIHFIRIGFICCSIGMNLTNGYIKGKNKTVWGTIVLLTVYIVVTTINYIYFGSDLLKSIIDPIFHTVIPCFVFQMCLNIELDYSPVYTYIRKLSILIYLTHFLLMKEAFEMIARLTGMSIFSECNIVAFVIDIVFAFILSNAIIALGKHRRFEWINKIY